MTSLDVEEYKLKNYEVQIGDLFLEQIPIKVG
jgi:hypothetical protein